MTDVWKDVASARLWTPILILVCWKAGVGVVEKDFVCAESIAEVVLVLAVLRTLEGVDLMEEVLE